MSLKSIFLLLVVTFIVLPAISQTATLNIKLKNNSGKAHRYVKINMHDKDTHEEFKATTDANGEADFVLPYDGNFEIVFSNSQIKRNMRMPGQEGISLKSTYTYNGGNDDWSKKFPPSESKKRQWEALFNDYADTTMMQRDSGVENYNERFQEFSIKLKDLSSGLLSDEMVYLRAEKHNKVFYGQTDRYGELSMLIPKGDKYFLDFVYDKAFEEMDVKLALGHSKQRVSIQYIGTKEIRRRNVEEEIRLKREEEDMKIREEEFAKRMKEEGKTEMEGYIDDLKSFKGAEDDVVSVVLKRNNSWNNKLITCDLTGSMDSYIGDLTNWYSKAVKTDKNLQFVFFNDGNDIDDDLKKIGSTGGIYYSSYSSYSELIKKIAQVRVAGDGGDTEENNIEALIYGINKAKYFNSLVMIADNNAPVKDMVLLDKVKKPVHIILCSVDDWVEEDYLTIAYRTKGSIHTISEDFNNIGKTRNGGRIRINGIEYLLMSNRFVRIE